MSNSKFVTKVTTVGLKNANGKAQVKGINGERIFIGDLKVEEGDYLLCNKQSSNMQYQRDSNGAIVNGPDGRPVTVEGNTTIERIFAQSVFKSEDEAIAGLNFSETIMRKAEKALVKAKNEDEVEILRHRAALTNSMQELYQEMGVSNKAELEALLF